MLFARSVGLMRHELEHAPEFGARFVNVHVGSHRGAGLDSGVRRLVDGIERVTDGLPSRGTDSRAPLIVLENSSGGGFAIGATIEELAMVLDAAAARGLADRLAFCLDAAHLWGAGYEVSSPAAIDELLTVFDRLIGLPWLAMIHSTTPTRQEVLAMTVTLISARAESAVTAWPICFAIPAWTTLRSTSRHLKWRRGSMLSTWPDSVISRPAAR